MIVFAQHHALLIFAVPIVAALACVALIVLLRPLLQRHALSRPNARSSHVKPTPQGGGLAVIAATAFAVTFVAPESSAAYAMVLAATLCLALLGMIDDLRPIPVIPRLALQALTIAFLLVMLPTQLRIVPVIPVWIERPLLALGLLWYVNLVNFMDGLDWMTVAEMLPMTAALATFGLMNEAPTAVLWIALALAGALLGFAPFNRPVARLFLGDVGSLPIGLLTGWSLFELAGRQHLAAALLLPLYYLADATITLLRRLARNERFWDAHRSHFYQRATVNGFSVMQVVTSVFLLNLFLAGLAIISVAEHSIYLDGAMLVLGSAGVAAVLNRFSRAQV
jgi:UDP-N-acetylmuramyl pentapeptide phosphotransferase/UDP-N-acetylglucosamine-1-phosphate transferase